MVNLDIVDIIPSCQDGRGVQGARLKVKYLPRTQWERAFWSPNEGVGSSPTPDNMFLFLLSHNLSHKNAKFQRGIWK